MNRHKNSGALIALMLIASLVLFAGIISAQDDDSGAIPLPAEATDDTVPPEETEDPLPTAIPTGLPTEEATDEPTEVPTDEPTVAPTDEPTQVPTQVPTEEATEEPTEEPTDDPGDGEGVAPNIIGINPPTATIDGAGYIDVIVTYEDFDGDASGFNWSIIETDASTTTMVPGRFSQAVVGTEIPVRFYCRQPEFTMEIELVVIDSMGNESEPESFELICNELEPEMDEDQGGIGDEEPTSDDPGSAPIIISIEPEVAMIEGADESTTVVVNYTDADGDATRFVWLMGENDMIDYDLPAGTFDQQTVGTQIPVEFFCTRPTFEAEIFLVVEDAQGNLSDSVPFTLTCER